VGLHLGNIYHGSYIVFDLYRGDLLHCLDGKWPEERGDNTWHWSDVLGPLGDWPGMEHFFSHSDCSGETSPEQAGQLVKELRQVWPLLSSDRLYMCSLLGERGKSQKTIVEVTDAIAIGFHSAAANGETVYWS